MERFIISHKAALVALAGLVILAWTGTAQAARNDFVLILDHRAGPYQYFHSFDKGGPRAYADALDKFGTPSSFRTDGNLCHVTWRNAGITIGFASALKPCSTGQLFHSLWYGMSLWGSQWHNQVGLRVGQSISQVRRLYPKAHLDSNYTSNRLIIAMLRDQEFNFVHLAVVVNRSGRVASIEVPATYVY
jgi:hypothetical protein